MRKKEREITDVEDMIRIIDSMNVIHLAMVDGDRPYIVPMNYGYTWEEGRLTFYFHGAKEGRKLEILAQNNRVCFELDCEHRLVENKLPCQYTYEFASVIGEGRAEFIEDPQEKIAAMKILMKHLSGRDFEFNEKLLGILTIIKLPIDSFTGKRRKLPVL